MRGLPETLDFLWLSSWTRLRRTSAFGALSAGLALYGDIVSPARDAIPVWTLVALGIALTSVIALLWLTRPQRPLVQIGGDGRRVLTAKSLPAPIGTVRDVAIFSLVASMLLGLTWAGQRWVADPNRDSSDGPSLFAALLSEVRGMRSDLSKVKRETSADPRKELANLGVPWTGDAMLEAVRLGDLRVLDLFLAGEMNPLNAQSQGRPLPVMLALNDGNAADVLDRLLDAGIDVDHVYDMHGGLGPVKTTLLGRAIERGNDALALALLERGAAVNTPIQTFGVMGITKNTFPLASAMQWQRFDVAAALLERGADPSQGGHFAYREAMALGARVRGAEEKSKLDRLQTRLAPSGAAGAQLRDQLRIQEIDAELNRVARESLREMPGSRRGIVLDRQYNELQRERAMVQGRLGKSPTN